MMFIVGSFATMYLMSILLWHEEGEHGPFPDNRRDVVRLRQVMEDHITEYRVRVTLFDWVRRVFGLYDVSRYEDVSGNVRFIWLVREERLPVWACTRCLSFWAALAVCIPLNFSIPLWWMPMFVLGMSGASYAIHWWIQKQLESNYPPYGYYDQDDGDGGVHESGE